MLWEGIYWLARWGQPSAGKGDTSLTQGLSKSYWCTHLSGVCVTETQTSQPRCTHQPTRTCTPWSISSCLPSLECHIKAGEGPQNHAPSISGTDLSLPKDGLHKRGQSPPSPHTTHESWGRRPPPQDTHGNRRQPQSARPHLIG
jgi:hypothetical protein